MAWIKTTDRNPTKKGYYRVKINGDPDPDFEDSGLNLFNGRDWDWFESCAQHVNEWWDDADTGNPATVKNYF